MERRDFRSIGRSAQEELRRRAVFLVEHDGLIQGEAARVVGVDRQAVNIWVKRHRAGGDEGLLDGRRVSPRRGKGALSEAEAKTVRSWITDKTPEQLRLPSYAPEHNPDEFLNGDLKQKLRQKPQAGSKDDLLKTTRAVMRAIQRSPKRIKTYFMAEPVKYAA